MEYTFTFTQQELSIIFTGLGELPLKTSINLFGKIQQTVSEQDSKQAVLLSDLEIKS